MAVGQTSKERLQQAFKEDSLSNSHLPIKIPCHVTTLEETKRRTGEL